MLHKPEPETRERPILFSAPMIRALLDGRKTMTRRIAKEFDGKDVDAIIKRFPRQHGCKYGEPGDRLWCRETWASGVPGVWTIDAARRNPGQIYYAADGGNGPWWPSIHMPREFSRIDLEITDIRVERLQDISEEDAIAEGMFFTDYGRQCFHPTDPPSPPRKYDPALCRAPVEHHSQYPGWCWRETESYTECLTSARMAFANLWIHINGEASWSANPFVWVISFKRLRP